MRLFVLLALLPAAALAAEPAVVDATSPSDFGSGPTNEVTRLALGAGTNLAPADPGWQGTIAIMGENREEALLTQISAGFEIVGTKKEGQDKATGRISQIVLNPLSIFVGAGAFRLGAGFDVAYAFHPIGASAQDATGWGLGGRAGGGLSLHPGPVNIWLLCQYRWLSGDRVGGVFFDLFVGPD